MSKIKIKNFGPIRKGYLENDGWLDIEKVTVFIGNQGSGKSTVAKLISTFTWIEKALTRGDYEIKEFTANSKFREVYCAYHKLENYFFDLNQNDVAELAYQGDSYNIKYQKGKLTIKQKPTARYPLPQIMYIPAERNFISTIKSPKLLRLSSESLVEFLTEFDNAKKQINGGLKLPINDTNVKYDKLEDILTVVGKDYKIRLTEASSGFQSLVPLFLVSWYLANSVRLHNGSFREPMSSDELDRFRKAVADIWSNNDFTDEQKRVAISALSVQFNKTAFINIVEEPEQNLFPTSQKEMLYSLLSLNNINEGNKLILTTHSPYIINYLSIAIQADELKGKLEQMKDFARLQNIIEPEATVKGEDVVIYQLDEKDGSINKLDNYEGVPSDRNYLNELLAEGNDLFDKLLEIEQSL